jgi:hypothetical protein
MKFEKELLLDSAQVAGLLSNPAQAANEREFEKRVNEILLLCFNEKTISEFSEAWQVLSDQIAIDIYEGLNLQTDSKRCGFLLGVLTAQVKWESSNLPEPGKKRNDD